MGVFDAGVMSVTGQSVPRIKIRKREANTYALVTVRQQSLRPMFSYLDITDCTSSVQFEGCGRVVFTGAGFATGGDIHPTEPYALIMVWSGRA
jgi:hypothetical protein